MRYLLPLLFVFFCTFSHSYAENGRLIKVALIDTGFDFKSDWANVDVKDEDGFKLVKPKICKDGHKDFTGKGLQDVNSHGTHLAGIIGKLSQKTNYCLVIMKIYHSASSVEANNVIANTKKALKYAMEIGIDIINYSSSGAVYNVEEYEIFKKVLDSGIIITTSVGNDKDRLDYNILKFKSVNRHHIPVYVHAETQFTTKLKQSLAYPSMYDPRIVSVGNIYRNKKISEHSGYGKAVRAYEVGVQVLSLLPNNKYGRQSGTSQSTAVRTAKIINAWYE